MSETAIYEFFIERPQSPSAVTTLAALQLGGGALSPAFDPDIRTYRAQIVGDDKLRVTPTASAGASLILLGTTADGAALKVSGDLVTGLTPGDNTIAIVLQTENGTNELYTLIARVTPSGDTSLATLKIANGELSPAFDPKTRRYRTRIVGNRLTVTSEANPGASVSMTGASAKGAALRVDGGSVSGLAAGENPVTLAVRAQNGTSDHYTLVVEVSDDIRKVGKGDTITRPSGCDSKVGCDGTMNGIEVRLACQGVDLRSGSSNTGINLRGVCLLRANAGVVKGAVGWYFAAFPGDSR